MPGLYALLPAIAWRIWFDAWLPKRKTSTANDETAA